MKNDAKTIYRATVELGEPSPEYGKCDVCQDESVRWCIESPPECDLYFCAYCSLVYFGIYKDSSVNINTRGCEPMDRRTGEALRNIVDEVRRALP